MEKPTRKKTTLNMVLKCGDDLIDQPVLIDVLALGHLCVHPTCELEGEQVVMTDTWTVSHKATGKSACGLQRFQSCAQAGAFLRLLDPTSARWNGTNQYRIASNVINLYQNAVNEMRSRDPNYASRVWSPIRGDKVVIVTYNRHTQTHTGTVVRVVTNNADEVKTDTYSFTRSPTGAWTSPPTRDLCTRTMIPYSSGNVARFVKEK